MFRIGGYPLTRFPTSANPWSTAPVQTQPSYTYFTPAQVPAAEELNFVFASMSDAAATGVTVAGASWLPDVAPTAISGSINAWVAAAWDSIDQEWLIAISDGNTSSSANAVMHTSGFDGTSGWGFVDGGAGITLAGKLTSVTFDGTHYLTTGIRDSDSTCLIYACTPGGGFSATVTTSVLTFADATSSIFQGQIVVVMWNSAAAHSVAWSSPVGSLSWSSVNVSTSINACTAGFQAQSPTLLLAVPSASGATVYGTTPDGVTWTTRSLPVNHADIFTGLCYSPADGAFVLMSQGTDSKGHTYVSFDGINWAEQGTGMVTVPTPRGLAATAAGCIVAHGDYSGVDYPIYSIDCGASWHWSAIVMGAPGFTAESQPKMVASPVNVVAFNNAHLRFSGSAGLGPAIT